MTTTIKALADALRLDRPSINGFIQTLVKLGVAHKIGTLSSGKRGKPDVVYSINRNFVKRFNLPESMGGLDVTIMPVFRESQLEQVPMMKSETVVTKRKPGRPKGESIQALKEKVKQLEEKLKPSQEQA